MTSLLKKVLLRSVLPILLILLCIELGTRVVQSCKAGNVQPLFHGFAELHRFLFEDKEEIIRRQGMFYVEKKKKLDRNMFDLTQGDIYRNQYYTFKKEPGVYRIIVFGASSVYSVTTLRNGTFPAVLENLLNYQTGQCRYEVINMGQVSHTLVGYPPPAPTGCLSLRA